MSKINKKNKTHKKHRLYTKKIKYKNSPRYKKYNKDSKSSKLISNSQNKKIHTQKKQTIYKGGEGMFQSTKQQYYNIEEDTTIHKELKNICQSVNFVYKDGNFYFPNGIIKRCMHKKMGKSPFCVHHVDTAPLFFKKYTNGHEPEFDVGFWNNPAAEGSHNCYSYFLNNMNHALKQHCIKECLKKYKDPKSCPSKIDECSKLKPQPADYRLWMDGDNKELRKLKRVYTCDAMERKIMADNPDLVKVGFFDKCPQQTYKGAMVVDPGHTFHFYRQNPDGSWSHKPGVQPVIDTDADKNKIYVPHICNRDYTDPDEDPDEAINYTDFCGYYCVPTRIIKK